MRRVLHKVSVDYVKLVAFIFVVVLALSSLFIFSVYKHHRENLHRQLEQQAFQLDVTTTQSFDYVAYLMGFLGSQIARNNADLQEVSKLYNGFKDDLKIKNLSSWSMFDWLTPDKNIRVTSTEGILSHPVSLADRTNLALADKYPGKIFLNRPAYGKISKQWIIPMAQAVEDRHGKRLGYINIGVTVSSVLSRLDSYSDHERITYALFTDTFQPVSADNNFLAELKRMGKTIQERKLSDTHGFLEEPVNVNGFSYVYYFKSGKYPFIFLLGYDKEEQYAAFIRNIVLPVAGFLALGIIAIGLSYLLYRRVISPIVTLGEAAGRMAQKNTEEDIQLPAHMPIEIRNLANQLHFVNLYKQQLVRAKEELEKANKTKTEFLSNMSHELRTPLNAIIGFSEMIQSGIFGEISTKNKEYAADIQSSGKHLLQLITDLLDINKAESGKFELREEEANVKDLIDHCLIFVQAKADQKNVRIRTLIPKNLPKLLCDPLRVKQALVNLLSNSVKYTLDGGTVTIGFEITPKTFNISVTDTGIGISDIDKALSVFGSLDNPQNRHGESTGLGLPLAKKLVELHDAKFDVKSQPGKGTCITLLFPKSRMATPEI